MSGPPIVVLADSDYSELFKDLQTGLQENSGTGNCVSWRGAVIPPPAATPPVYGLAGPFLDSVYLSGCATLTKWAGCIWDASQRKRGVRYCWPLDDHSSIWTPDALPDLDAVPEHARWLVLSKYHEGHLALPVEFCGSGQQEGVRILIGPPNTKAISQFKIFISPKPLFLLRQQYGNYNDVLAHIMESITGSDEGNGNLVFSDYDLTGAELHATVDTWGHAFSIFDVKEFITLRRTFKGEAGSGDDTVSLEIDNTVPIFTKKYADSETIYQGQRGTDSRQSCIYNKTLHATKNGSISYLAPFWLANGWDGKSKVFRIEIRHGQGYLRKHGGFTVPPKLVFGDELSPFVDIEKALFQAYLLQTRFVQKDSSRRFRRCKNHPFWDFLNSKLFTNHQCSWQWRPRTMKINTDAVQLTQMAVGCTSHLIQLVQQNACLRCSSNRKEIWTRESVISYKAAKEHVLHELSLLIDEKTLGRNPTQKDLAATIKHMADMAASAEYEPQEAV